MFEVDMNRYTDEIIAGIRRMVAVKSVQEPALPGKPFGEGPAAVLAEFLKLAEELGFETENDDNYAGCVSWGEGEETVTVLNHLDTVPLGEGWKHDPLGCELENGCMFGRGTEDNKGPAVVSLYCMKALRDAGFEPKRKICLVLGCNEETGMLDMEHYYAGHPLPDYAFSPDAGYPVCNREKGGVNMWVGLPGIEEPRLLDAYAGQAFNVVPHKCTVKLDAGSVDATSIASAAKHLGFETELNVKGDVLTVTTVGKAAHAAAPQNGRNAIGMMSILLTEVFGSDFANGFFAFFASHIGMESDGAGLGAACSDEESGALTLNVGMLRYEEGALRFSIDIRYPVTLTAAPYLENICSECGEAGYWTKLHRVTRPLYIPEDSFLITKLKSAYEYVTGEPCIPFSMGGGTYAKKLGNKGVAFGGIDGGNGHDADEFIRLEGIPVHANICARAMYELAK